MKFISSNGSHARRTAKSSALIIALALIVVLAVGGTVAYIFTQTDSGWQSADDGYYYWVSPVPAGGKTGFLIDKCEVIADAPADGYTLHVEIVAQAIQATPIDAVQDSWGVTVDDNGRISK